jgi:hypothetical protein
MYRVRNAHLAGLKAITAYGIIEFDNLGYATIPNRDLYEALLKNPQFEAVEEEPKEQEAAEDVQNQEAFPDAVDWPEEEVEIQKVVETEPLEEAIVASKRRKKAKKEE